MSDEKGISRVRSSEINRGKKTSSNLRRKEERLKALLLTALEKGDRRLFEMTLIDLGQPLGSKAHDDSMRLFDDYRAKK
jgi:hypothetical protein